MLDPVFTIVWMVEDTMRFENEDYVSYLMTPELVLDFVRNEKLWKTNDIQMIMNERAQVMQSISNKYHEIAFLEKNRLVFLFQKNIVTNEKLEKYVKWFIFAEKTKKKDNAQEDFKEFEGDPVFEEMMRRLNQSALSEEDIQYIHNEHESWEEVRRFEEELMDKGMQKGMEKGIIIGEINALSTMLNNPSLPQSVINDSKERIQVLNDQLKSISS
ncbi:MAG: hypothetical protein OMM_09671 [Candidatus Magnetoglobus multicellularis str. Araruama]|uniref:Uncharacterized protein n=1 Tax=Candidatus Magnetoglobus multicellularis str. Araruama TaxID=890399 RepID=A0A1V1P3B9_9BACT|nr:MAG: hypothetical protein OMM_09671 [Candidatus Magnetoglobus multicellularis str. Araruama]